MKKIIFTLLIVMFGSSLTAQITYIPDFRFEQALIDLGIDSDGIINGQVLTADVENVIVLDIADRWIDDLTGIEDFISIEHLRAEFNNIQELNVSTLVNLKILNCIVCSLTELDLSNNIQLESLLLSNDGDTIPFNDLQYIDLSNNPNIKEVGAEEMYNLQYINLNNGNNQEGMFIDVYREYSNIPVCIQVDDPDAANSDQYPYSTWDVYGEYYFSSECSLSVPESAIGLNLYPNPVIDFLYINNAILLKEILVYDVLGTVLLKKDANTANIRLDFSGFSSGMYFLKVYTHSGGQLVKPVIKK